MAIYHHSSLVTRGAVPDSGLSLEDPLTSIGGESLSAKMPGLDIRLLRPSVGFISESVRS